MTEKDLIARVTRIVAEQLGLAEGEVQFNRSFVADLGADSLDTVELVMALEDEFDIEIPDDDAEKAVTVQDAIILLAAQMEVPLSTLQGAQLTVKPSARKVAPDKGPKPIKRKKLIRLMQDQARSRGCETALGPLFELLLEKNVMRADAEEKVNQALNEFEQGLRSI